MPSKGDDNARIEVAAQRSKADGDAYSKRVQTTNTVGQIVAASEL